MRTCLCCGALARVIGHFLQPGPLLARHATCASEPISIARWSVGRDWSLRREGATVRLVPRPLPLAARASFSSHPAVESTWPEAFLGSGDRPLARNSAATEGTLTLSLSSLGTIPTTEYRGPRTRCSTAARTGNPSTGPRTGTALGLRSRHRLSTPLRPLWILL